MIGKLKTKARLFLVIAMSDNPSTAHGTPNFGHT